MRLRERASGNPANGDTHVTNGSFVVFQFNPDGSTGRREFVRGAIADFEIVRALQCRRTRDLDPDDHFT